MLKHIFLVAGILSIVLNYNKILIVETPIIVGCFALWIISLYWSIHKKNKDLRTPRPVYNVG